MNILLISLSTIILSYGLELINELSIFKDIANRGYKIDMNKVSKYINQKENKKFYLKLLVPGLNIIEVFKRMNNYEKEKINLFSKLDKIDMFVKMSDEEYQRYLDTLNQ